ncbi:hypothetical protein LCGC14_1700260 [marine sediment metagenome]|uniref:Uncharacterized protein n=1 Tax=marine sediment metagenome TaxID=412755 RepID=A0A0F9KI89_9ZZZZ
MVKTKELAKGLKVTFSRAEYPEGQDSVHICIGNKKMIGIYVPVGHTLDDLEMRYSPDGKGWQSLNPGS